MWLYDLLCFMCVFFFKQKTAYEMRISDWSSDVCSSDLCTCLMRNGSSYKPDRTSSSPSILQSHLGTLPPLWFYSLAETGSSANTEIGRASCRERVCQSV